MDSKISKDQLLKQLYTRYPTCDSFPITQTGATRVVYGHGPTTAKIMIIGEAPGKDEDLQGKPFVGRSGQLLSKALTSAGLDKENLFITNVVKCRPPNNRIPTPQEIESYTSLLLLEEIKIIQPRVLLLLGAVATTAILKKTGITKLRGTMHQFLGAIVIPTLHPAYILRNQTALNLFCADLKLAKKISFGE